MSQICLFNRQRSLAVDLRLLRRIARALLDELPGVENYELGVHLVGVQKMTSLNETFLGHQGPTDVITFDYSPSRSHLYGELFICTAVAVVQAAQFRATWPEELARYLAHGVLHLRGYQDDQPVSRRKMKREEQRLLGLLAKRFALNKLERVKRGK